MRRWLILPTLALAVLLLSDIIMAQVGDGYDLSWSTVDGGGYTFSEGGGYQLGGTVGQPDAGTMIGHHYTHGGGFWSSLVTIAYQEVYLPLILKNFGP